LTLLFEKILLLVVKNKQLRWWHRTPLRVELVRLFIGLEIKDPTGTIIKN